MGECLGEMVSKKKWRVKDMIISMVLQPCIHVREKGKTNNNKDDDSGEVGLLKRSEGVG